MNDWVTAGVNPAYLPPSHFKARDCEASPMGLPPSQPRVET